ncbi:MAG: hypothetical protein IJG13_17060 [Kiritimatiellae bacterium]|nr:hypothetical protein [Kiritimatiellia bacterium]
MSFLSETFKAIDASRPTIAAKCPVCGMMAVKSRIRKPLGPFVKDGPTVMEMKCGKCGHSWSIPLRVGP